MLLDAVAYIQAHSDNFQPITGIILGTGLGALVRLSDEFDVYTRRGEGAAFFMRLWRDEPAPHPRGVEVGALWAPIAGEDECGDGWAVSCGDDGATILACDGLGHGPNAAAATNAAKKARRQQREAEEAGAAAA